MCERRSELDNCSQFSQWPVAVCSQVKQQRQTSEIELLSLSLPQQKSSLLYTHLELSRAIRFTWTDSERHLRAIWWRGREKEKEKERSRVHSQSSVREDEKSEKRGPKKSERWVRWNVSSASSAYALWPVKLTIEWRTCNEREWERQGEREMRWSRRFLAASMERTWRGEGERKRRGKVKRKRWALMMHMRVIDEEVIHHEKWHRFNRQWYTITLSWWLSV